MEEVKLNYTNINHNARHILKLSVNAYCVADAIYHLSNNPKAEIIGWCFASKDYLGKNLDLSRQTVHSIINKLLETGYIEKSNETGYLRVTEIWYQVVIGNSKETLQSVKKVYTPVKEVDTDSKKSLHNNNIYNNNYNTISKDIEAKPLKGKIVDPQIPQTSVVLSSSGKRRPVLKNGRYGNPEINEFLDYFKERLGLTILDGTEATNRQYTNLLFKKFGGLEKCKLLIDATVQSQFWATKVTSVQKLYYKGVEISSSLRSQKGGVLDASSI